MDDTIILAWAFTPADFFEEDVEFDVQGHIMRVSPGRVEAVFTSNEFDASPSLKNDLHEALEARFFAGLVRGHTTYKLSGPMKTVVHSDGMRDSYIQAGASRSAVVIGEAVDIRRVGEDGQVIYDSKRERIEGRNRMGELLAKHCKDHVLKGMIKSFEAAIKDAHDALVHLYEIRDAAVKMFGNEKAAQQALGVSGKKWGRFGTICNDPSLRQGRHRGKKEEELRDATGEEAEFARGFAQSLIEGYVCYLETQPTAQAE